MKVKEVQLAERDIAGSNKSQLLTLFMDIKNNKAKYQAKMVDFHAFSVYDKYVVQLFSDHTILIKNTFDQSGGLVAKLIDKELYQSVSSIIDSMEMDYCNQVVLDLIDGIKDSKAR